MKISDQLSSVKTKLMPQKDPNQPPVKPVEVKIHKQPKTERLYEPVSCAQDLIRVIEKHGEKIAYSYFDKRRTLLHMTYGEFGSMIRKVAAGLTAQGYAGKRIALIGETSVQWLASYLAILATGGVVIPMDKELEIEVIGEFLKSVDADGIVYSATFNGKFTAAMESHPSLSLFIPIDPDDEESKDLTFFPLRTCSAKEKWRSVRASPIPRWKTTTFFAKCSSPREPRAPASVSC